MKNNIFPNDYPRKGEIYYVVDNPEKPSFGNEIWSDRCAVVVSNDSTNKYGGFVEVVYLLTSPERINNPSPTHIRILSNKRQAVTTCEQVHSVDIRRLTHYIDRIPEEQIKEIDEGIIFGLGINYGVSPQGIFKKWEKYIKTYPKLTETFHKYPSRQTEQMSKDMTDMLSILTKERDSYKNLCDTLQQKLDSIHSLTK